MTTYSLADGINFTEESITYIFFFKTGEAGASETSARLTYHTTLCSLPSEPQTCEFIDFRSGTITVSALLRCAAASHGYWCPTFRHNVETLSSRVEISTSFNTKDETTTFLVTQATS